jgi:hypothetical protein
MQQPLFFSHSQIHQHQPHHEFILSTSPTCREPAQQCAAMRHMPLSHLIEFSAHKTGEPLLCPQPA